MPGRWRPIAETLTLLTLVAGGCFGVQAALPLPSRASLIASQVLERLPVFRRVSSVEPIASSPPLDTPCNPPATDTGSAALANAGLDIRRSTDPEALVDASSGRAATIRGLKHGLAACPLALRDLVGAELGRGTPVAIVGVLFDGKPAYRLRFLSRTSLTIYVDRRTLAVLNVRVRRVRQPGWSGRVG